MFYYFSFLFYRHSFLRPVEYTVLNSETGNCNGSEVVIHLALALSSSGQRRRRRRRRKRRKGMVGKRWV